jgi:copper(I)-binding protein
MRKDVTPVIDRARPRPTRAALVVGALLGAAALAGCGAGQVTQTNNQVTAVEGGNAEAGRIAVRNATIEFDAPAEGAAVYPAGGEAPLAMTIVNSGAEIDRLVAASSPIASSVQISGVLRIPGGQSLTVAGAPAAVAAVSTEGAAPAEGVAPAEEPAPADGAAPAAAEAPAPAPAPDEAAAAPEAAAQPGAPGQANVVLTGLREDVQAGQSYPVTLTFERAGTVQVDVPVAFPDTLREDEHA